MKQMVRVLAPVVLLVLSIGACGGDGDGGAGGMGPSASGSPSTGGGGSSSGGGATAGSKNTSGATSGGSSAGQAGNTTGGIGGTGSTGGTGNTGPGLSDMACAPGMSYGGFAAYPDPIQNCGFEGKGELAGVEGFFSSIKLASPLAPGDQFSFSVDLAGKLGEGSMELWGGTGECGDAKEHLATVQIPAGGADAIACLNAAPKNGTYPYLIWVRHTAGQHGDVTLCPSVACPAD